MKRSRVITLAAKTEVCIVRLYTIVPHFPLDGSHDSADRTRANERTGEREGERKGGGQIFAYISQ